MVDASPRSIGQGPAWKKVRLEVLIISGSLMAAGALLLVLPRPEQYSDLLLLIGVAFIFTGAMVAATRPWSFMKKMEMQLLVHQESLRGISESKRQEEESARKRN